MWVKINIPFFESTTFCWQILGGAWWLIYDYVNKTYLGFQVRPLGSWGWEFGRLSIRAEPHRCHAQPLGTTCRRSSSCSSLVLTLLWSTWSRANWFFRTFRRFIATAESDDTPVFGGSFTPSALQRCHVAVVTFGLVFAVVGDVHGRIFLKIVNRRSSVVIWRVVALEMFQQKRMSKGGLKRSCYSESRLV